MKFKVGERVQVNDSYVGVADVGASATVESTDGDERVTVSFEFDDVRRQGEQGGTYPAAWFDHAPVFTAGESVACRFPGKNKELEVNRVYAVTRGTSHGVYLGRRFYSAFRFDRVPSETPSALSEPQEQANPKQRFGVRKPPLGLIPPSAEIECSLAFGDGMEKYGAYNFRLTKVEAMTYIHAAKRHIAAWLDGEEHSADTTAKGSPVHHLGHVMACCAIIIDAQSNGFLIDNRPPKGNASALIDAKTKKDAK